MLTIRFMANDGGEFVRPVRSVHYIPPNGERLDFLAVYPEDGEPENLYAGTAYVMNDSGKTVATYHLQMPPKNAVESPA